MSLMRVDLAPYNGDGLVTYDTATQLEWLNLGVTLNHSCLDARALRFMTRDGFRFAAPNEVSTLWGHAGISRQSGPTSPPDPASNAGIGVLLRFLGGSSVSLTSPPIQVIESSAGFVPEPASLPTLGPTTPVIRFELFLNRTSSPMNGYGDSGTGMWHAGTRDEAIGVYLVRARP
jgi:hypothetical protein